MSISRYGPCLTALLLAVVAGAALVLESRSASSDPPEMPARGGIEITQLPFTIQHCGYYFISECLRGEAGQDGITVLVSDVTIDLRGFTLFGVVGSLSAVRMGAAVHAVCVENGNLEGWGDHGVHADLGTSCTFRNLVLKDNDKNGIRGGANALVQGCTSDSSGDAGITASSGIIERCRATGGGNDGFFLGKGVVSECVAELNDLHGIITGGACTIERCTVSDSGNDGIDAGEGSTVADCTVTNSDGHGIHARAGASVHGSTATGNDRAGISLVDGASATGCTASQNTDGIRATSNCSIRSSSCSANLLAGIRALFPYTGTRIEDNHVVANAFGIQADGTRHLVVRNHASANGIAYQISPGNAFGQLVNVAGTGSFVSTDPWLNFVY